MFAEGIHNKITENIWLQNLFSPGFLSAKCTHNKITENDRIRTSLHQEFSERLKIKVLHIHVRGTYSQQDY